MGKTLRLTKAATADAGSYSCKAINIAGSTEKDFFLDVLGEQWSMSRPRITKKKLCAAVWTHQDLKFIPH